MTLWVFYLLIWMTFLLVSEIILFWCLHLRFGIILLPTLEEEVFLVHYSLWLGIKLKHFLGFLQVRRFVCVCPVLTLSNYWRPQSHRPRGQSVNPLELLVVMENDIFVDQLLSGCWKFLSVVTLHQLQRSCCMKNLKLQLLLSHLSQFHFTNRTK